MKAKVMTALKLFQKREIRHKELTTEWGEALQTEHVLPEHPRPQFRREAYRMLNGYWDYTIVDEADNPNGSSIPVRWSGKILVPFSPECRLSGVALDKPLAGGQQLWYRTVLRQRYGKRRTLLHFDAVDERCIVYINGKPVGTHEGGYLAFSFDITSYLKREGENTLCVCVWDDTDASFHARGKQKQARGGMFYTPQSGIWQSVWLEEVPQTYLDDIRIIPDFDGDSVEIELFGAGEMQSGIPVRITVTEADGRPIAEQELKADAVRVEKVRLLIPDKVPWTPQSPYLYNMDIVYGADCVHSYFAMRHFSVEKDGEQIPRLCLNHVPYFMRGVLDQGYWPESLMTPPSDEAMIADITSMKRMGFNMLRKHCKLEPFRWYYHCDRIGMLVWQDIVNGGGQYNSFNLTILPTIANRLTSIFTDTKRHYWITARRQAEGRAEWKRQCSETVNQLYNVPSLAMWVMFNEGWGQFDSIENEKLLRSADATRWIDAASGWFDQGNGDVKSEHNYFWKYRVNRGRRPYVLSEYGGVTWKVEGHTWSENVYGYGICADGAEFADSYLRLQEKMEQMCREGMCACVYTQLSDVEEEINGLLTYDRRVNKLEKARQETETGV